MAQERRDAPADTCNDSLPCIDQASDLRRTARASPGSTIFDARLDIRVRHFDEPAERCGICRGSRSKLHMTHELAVALQQAGRIGQGCAMIEPHVDMRSEYIDVAERRVPQTGNRTAVM